MIYSTPKDYHGIIDNIHNLLNADPTINVRNGLITEYYKYINAEELVEGLLQKNQSGEEFRMFSNPVICIATGNIDFKQTVPNVITGDQIEAMFFIDIIYTNDSLLEAKKQALLLTEDIRQVLKESKMLVNSVYEARVTKFIEAGFIKHMDYPYYYAYRIPLKTVFR